MESDLQNRDSEANPERARGAAQCVCAGEKGFYDEASADSTRIPSRSGLGRGGQFHPESCMPSMHDLRMCCVVGYA